MALNKRVVLRLKAAAKDNTGRIHVVSRESGWAIRKEGAPRALKVFSIKKEAVSAAKDYVQKGLAKEVVVHKKDGSVNLAI